MVKIIGVRFRNVGKVYYFNPRDLKIKAGDHVIVETARGVWNMELSFWVRKRWMRGRWCSR